MVDSLIKTVMQLYVQISTRLLQFRVDKAGLHGGPTRNIDIAESLITRVREYSAESKGGSQGKTGPTEPNDTVFEYDAANGENQTARGGAPVPEPKSPIPQSDLALQFSKEPRAGVMSPPIGEQLKRRTFNYINQALELAKQGKVERAETYAQLAESAFKTAADHLSAEEYLAFSKEVMSRIHLTDRKSD